MIKFLSGACLSLAILAAAPVAQAAAPRPLEEFKDWKLYRNDGKQPYCYIMSQPTESTGTFKKRGPAVAFVLRVPGASAANQVTVQAGYPFRAKSEVAVKVEGDAFAFFTEGEHAWARDGEDAPVIKSMQKGSSMTVRGTSTRGTYSVDTFSLAGFSAAFDALQKACKK